MARYTGVPGKDPKEDSQQAADAAEHHQYHPVATPSSGSYGPAATPHVGSSSASPSYTPPKAKPVKPVSRSLSLASKALTERNKVVRRKEAKAYEREAQAKIIKETWKIGKDGKPIMEKSKQPVLKNNVTGKQVARASSNLDDKLAEIRDKVSNKEYKIAKGTGYYAIGQKFYKTNKKGEVKTETVESPKLKVSPEVYNAKVEHVKDTERYIRKGTHGKPKNPLKHDVDNTPWVDETLRWKKKSLNRLITENGGKPIGATVTEPTAGLPFIPAGAHGSSAGGKLPKRVPEKVTAENLQIAYDKHKDSFNDKQKLLAEAILESPSPEELNATINKKLTEPGFLEKVSNLPGINVFKELGGAADELGAEAFSTANKINTQGSTWGGSPANDALANITGDKDASLLHYTLEGLMRPGALALNFYARLYKDLGLTDMQNIPSYEDTLIHGFNADHAVTGARFNKNLFGKDFPAELGVVTEIAADPLMWAGAGGIIAKSAVKAATLEAKIVRAGSAELLNTAEFHALAMGAKKTGNFDLLNAHLEKVAADNGLSLGIKDIGLQREVSRAIKNKKKYLGKIKGERPSYLKRFTFGKYGETKPAQKGFNAYADPEVSNIVDQAKRQTASSPSTYSIAPVNRFMNRLGLQKNEPRELTIRTSGTGRLDESTARRDMVSNTIKSQARSRRYEPGFEFRLVTPLGHRLAGVKLPFSENLKLAPELGGLAIHGPNYHNQIINQRIAEELGSHSDEFARATAQLDEEFDRLSYQLEAPKPGEVIDPRARQIKAQSLREKQLQMAAKHNELRNEIVERHTKQYLNSPVTMKELAFAKNTRQEQHAVRRAAESSGRNLEQQFQKHMKNAGLHKLSDESMARVRLYGDEIFDLGWSPTFAERGAPPLTTEEQHAFDMMTPMYEELGKSDRQTGFLGTIIDDYRSRQATKPRQVDSGAGVGPGGTPAFAKARAATESSSLEDPALRAGVIREASKRGDGTYAISKDEARKFAQEDWEHGHMRFTGDQLIKRIERLGMLGSEELGKLTPLQMQFLEYEGVTIGYEPKLEMFYPSVAKDSSKERFGVFAEVETDDGLKLGLADRIDLRTAESETSNWNPSRWDDTPNAKVNKWYTAYYNRDKIDRLLERMPEDSRVYDDLVKQREQLQREIEGYGIKLRDFETGTKEAYDQAQVVYVQSEQAAAKKSGVEADIELANGKVKAAEANLEQASKNLKSAPARDGLAKKRAINRTKKEIEYAEAREAALLDAQRQLEKAESLVTRLERLRDEVDKIEAARMRLLQAHGRVEDLPAKQQAGKWETDRKELLDEDLEEVAAHHVEDTTPVEPVDYEAAFKEAHSAWLNAQSGMNEAIEPGGWLRIEAGHYESAALPYVIKRDSKTSWKSGVKDTSQPAGWIVSRKEGDKVFVPPFPGRHGTLREAKEAMYDYYKKQADEAQAAMQAAGKGETLGEPKPVATKPIEEGQAVDYKGEKWQFLQDRAKYDDLPGEKIGIRKYGHDDGKLTYVDRSEVEAWDPNFENEDLVTNYKQESMRPTARVASDAEINAKANAKLEKLGVDVNDPLRGLDESIARASELRRVAQGRVNVVETHEAVPDLYAELKRLETEGVKVTQQEAKKAVTAAKSRLTKARNAEERLIKSLTGHKGRKTYLDSVRDDAEKEFFKRLEKRKKTDPALVTASEDGMRQGYNLHTFADTDDWFRNHIKKHPNDQLFPDQVIMDVDGQTPLQVSESRLPDLRQPGLGYNPDQAEVMARRVRGSARKSVYYDLFRGLGDVYGVSDAEIHGSVAINRAGQTVPADDLMRIYDEGHQYGWGLRSDPDAFFELGEFYMHDGFLKVARDRYYDPVTKWEYVKPGHGATDHPIGQEMQAAIGNETWLPAHKVSDVIDEQLWTQGDQSVTLHSEGMWDQGMTTTPGRVMSTIRFGVTQYFPSYHVRNVTSDVLKSLQADTAVIFHPLAALQLVRLSWRRGGNAMFRLPGIEKELSPQEALFVMDHFGLTSSQHLAEFAHLTVEGDKKPGWWKRSTLGAKSHLGKSLIEMGARREDMVRFITFAQRMRRNGGDVADATWYAVKHHFDYSDLGNYERTKLRNFFLFYTWYRKNIPLQFMELVTRPGFFAAVGHIYEDLPKGQTPLNRDWGQIPFTDTDLPGPLGGLPDLSGKAKYAGLIPDYIIDQLGGAVVNYNGHTASFATGAPWVDMNLVSNLITNPQNSAKQFASLTNPALSLLVQSAYQIEPFTGREYKTTEPVPDLTKLPGPLGDLFSPLMDALPKDEYGRPTAPWFINALMGPIPIAGRGGKTLIDPSYVPDSASKTEQGLLRFFGGVNPYILPDNKKGIKEAQQHWFDARLGEHLYDVGQGYWNRPKGDQNLLMAEEATHDFREDVIAAGIDKSIWQGTEGSPWGIGETRINAQRNRAHKLATGEPYIHMKRNAKDEPTSDGFYDSPKTSENFYDKPTKTTSDGFYDKPEKPSKDTEDTFEPPRGSLTKEEWKNRRLMPRTPAESQFEYFNRVYSHSGGPITTFSHKDRNRVGKTFRHLPYTTREAVPDSQPPSEGKSKPVSAQNPSMDAWEDEFLAKQDAKLGLKPSAPTGRKPLLRADGTVIPRWEDLKPSVYKQLLPATRITRAVADVIDLIEAPKEKQVATIANDYIKAWEEAQPKGRVPDYVPENMRGYVVKHGAMLEPALKAAGSEFSGPEYLARLIEFESGWDANIENADSGAFGYGQFIDSTAETFRTAYGVETQDPNDPEGMIKGAAMHASGDYGHAPLYGGYNPGYSDTDPIETGERQPDYTLIGGGKATPIPTQLKKQAQEYIGKEGLKLLKAGGKIVKAPEKGDESGMQPGPWEGSQSIIKELIGPKYASKIDWKDKEDRGDPGGTLHDIGTTNAFAADISMDEGGLDTEKLVDRIAKTVGLDPSEVNYGTTGLESGINYKGYDIEFLPYRHGSGDHVHIAAQWNGGGESTAVPIQGTNLAVQGPPPTTSSAPVTGTTGATTDPTLTAAPGGSSPAALGQGAALPGNLLSKNASAFDRFSTRFGDTNATMDEYYGFSKPEDNATQAAADGYGFTPTDPTATEEAVTELVEEDDRQRYGL